MWLLLAFKNLFRNLRRTLAILFTIALGSGALFSFDGFINGILHQYREDTIHSHYGHGQIYTKGYRGSVFEKPQDHWIDNREELNKYLIDLEGVDQIFPRVSFSALLTSGKVTVSGSGQGIEARKEASFFHSLNVETGVTLLDQETGILLGKGLAEALNVKPGDTVTVIATSMKGYLNRSKFVVTGIFHTGSLDYDRRVFQIQLNEAQSLLKTSKIELVSLGIHDLSQWDRVAKAVEKAFPNLEATSFDVLDKVYYKHSVDWLNAQFHVVQIIILGVVLLGIFNTISSSILERKQEIGNLRANGESISQVMQLIMTEGAFLGIFGSAIGMLLSYFFLMTFIDKGILMPPGPGFTKQFLVSFRFEWSMVFITLLLSVASSIVASCLAGIKVAKMPIAKSLRSY